MRLAFRFRTTRAVRTKPQTQPPVGPPGHPEPLSVAQAAQLVGVSEQALRKRIRKGTLPAHKLRRGNQIVTVLAPWDLALAYPEAAERLGPLGGDSKPVGQPPQGGQESAGEAEEEARARLREDLATAVAARRAADQRCEAAEARAERAEEKLERALVQRGDEIARTRKEAEQQAMQMAMEIARAQIQALPESSLDSAPRSRRWFGGLALGALVVAAAATAWGWQVWSELDSTRAQTDSLAAQAVELQERATGFLARAVEAETSQMSARQEALQAQLAVAEERLAWEERERGLRAELSRREAAVERLREELMRSQALRQGRINVALTANLLQRLARR